MFPIPQLAKQLEQEWAFELAAVFGCELEAFRQNPTRFLDFPSGTLRIELMDGSFVEFQRALHVLNEEKKTIAVFTEHTGHHLFPYHEARVIRDGKTVYEKNMSNPRLVSDANSALRANVRAPQPKRWTSQWSKRRNSYDH